uniref:Uncharacterized protein n=1 Tax=Rhizophora mucronata TaxID=61149 RepID=A0A2P2Q2L2_RHIMU
MTTVVLAILTLCSLSLKSMNRLFLVFSMVSFLNSLPFSIVPYLER